MFWKNWVVEVEDWSPSSSISSYLWCLPSHIILHSVFNMIYDFISIRKRRLSFSKTKSFSDGHFPYNGPWPQDLISQKAVVTELKQTRFMNFAVSFNWCCLSPHLRHQQSMLHYKSSTEAFEHEYAASSHVCCIVSPQSEALEKCTRRYRDRALIWECSMLMLTLFQHQQLACRNKIIWNHAPMPYLA